MQGNKVSIVAKKILVMLPAIIIVALFAQDHMNTYRFINTEYSINRFINIAPFLVFVLWSTRKRKQTNFMDAAVQSSFNIYIFGVLSLTIFYIPFWGILNALVDGVLFQDIMQNYRTIAEHGFSQGVNLTPLEKFKIYSPTDRQVIGNLLLLFPLGFFLPLIYNVSSFIKFFFISFFITISIEVTQFILTVITPWSVGFYSRSLDIDDIILNATGAVAGYFVYIIIKARSNRTRMKHSKTM